jgi:hypothetical protein
MIGKRRYFSNKELLDESEILERYISEKSRG